MRRKHEQVIQASPTESMLMYTTSLLTLALLPALLHPVVTKEIASLLLGESPECSNINEINRLNQTFDILVIPGAGKAKISSTKTSAQS